MSFRPSSPFFEVVQSWMAELDAVDYGGGGDSRICLVQAEESRRRR